MYKKQDKTTTTIKKTKKNKKKKTGSNTIHVTHNNPAYFPSGDFFGNSVFDHLLFLVPTVSV